MKILICLDYSAASDIVLKESENFLQAFSQAEVYVHTVKDISALSAELGFDDTIREKMEAEANELKQRAEAVFGTRAIIFSSSLGLPVDDIIERAGELRCDLLILGTHGRTGLSHLLIGSVAEQVLRKAEWNTLVIPVKKKM